MEQNRQTEKKYAAIVLRNTNHSVRSVRFVPITDALLSGGVRLNELVLLSYDTPDQVISAIKRLSADHDGVFLICDKVLVKIARDAVTVAAEQEIPDFILETSERLFAVLPVGDKGEEIVRTALVPAVERRRNERFSRVVIRTVSAPADVLLSAVSAAQGAADESVSIVTGGEYGCERIEIVYNQLTPKMVTDQIVRILASELKDYVYAMEDTSIAKRLVELLTLHRLHIATAESFTGGGVGKAIVSVPGASKVFYEAVNAYDNLSKINRLGVNEYTLRSKGAVSNETAYEMAAGLLKAGHCDVAVATTGIAGPSSDGTDKPVGLFYIAIGSSERVRVFEYRLNGSREEITETAINLALFLAFKEINR